MPIRIGGMISEPMELTKVVPVAPPFARRDGTAWTVTLDGDIDESLTTAEIVELYARGAIDDATEVRKGHDVRRLLDHPELSAAIGDRLRLASATRNVDAPETSRRVKRMFRDPASTVGHDDQTMVQRLHLPYQTSDADNARTSRPARRDPKQRRRPPRTPSRGNFWWLLLAVGLLVAAVVGVVWVYLTYESMIRAEP